MGRPRKIWECAVCGKETFRRGRATEGVLCLDCSLDKSAEVMQQLRMKRGPYYDQWLAGMQAAVDKATAQQREDARVLDGDIPW